MRPGCREHAPLGPPVSTLLVEDSPLIALATEKMLGHLGAVVITTALVSEAARLIRDNRFDLALVELDLCSGEGLTIARLLFAAKIPIILTTTVDVYLPESVLAVRILRKPYSFEELQRAVAQVERLQ